MNNLEPLITQHIRPGSIIMSDQWWAYNDIERLVDSNGELMNYKHHTVNHKVGFVNFDNPWIHTKTIEWYWGDIKERGV